MERGGGEVALRGRSDRDGFVANEMARWVVFGSVLELLYCRFSAWGLLGFDILSGRVFTVSRCVFFFFGLYRAYQKAKVADGNGRIMVTSSRRLAYTSGQNTVGWHKRIGVCKENMVARRETI